MKKIVFLTLCLIMTTSVTAYAEKMCASRSFVVTNWNGEVESADEAPLTPPADEIPSEDSVIEPEEPDTNYDEADLTGENDVEQDINSNDLKIRHNALIISRLGADQALHTEISVENIVEADVDVFPEKEGEKADTIFISLENENGTVKMFRIGLYEEIDQILFLEGVSSDDLLSDDSGAEPVTDLTSNDVNDFKPPEEYFVPFFVGLDQMKCPVIIILPDTGEHIYFPSGKSLSEQPFEEKYEIEEIRAVRDEIQIRLKSDTAK